MTGLLFTGGTVWTATGSPAADALLVIDGAVAAVGAGAHERAAGLDDIARVDLDGGFLMPSFGDGHAHPLYAGLETFGPQLGECSSVDDIVEAVRAFAARNPDAEWIVGASYQPTLAARGEFDARWLDAAVADRPVALRASDYHTLWCNSMALRRCGIDENTPDPPLGTIVRRADGSPMGTLREWGAVDLVLDHCPPPSVDDGVAALGVAADYYLARGVTWVQDAWVTPDAVEAYVAAAGRDALRMRVNLGLYADPRNFNDQLVEFAAARRRVGEAASPMLTANTVKFFADGVVESETGALLAPYCSAGHSHGMTVWPADTLAEAARQVDEAGFQIHIHAIGDAAVRQALDAVDHVARSNPVWDRRPVIAHVQLADDTDIDRFAELGVTANMQPLWAQMDDYMKRLAIPRLGPQRADNQFRMNSIRSRGARLAFGSDWPVTSGAPLEGIAVALSRPGGDGGPWRPEEILTVEEALTAYTAAVAEQAFADQQHRPWGRLEPGASADLVWLDRDPHTVTPEEVAGLRVRATYLGGDRVSWP